MLEPYFNCRVIRLSQAVGISLQHERTKFGRPLWLFPLLLPGIPIPWVYCRLVTTEILEALGFDAGNALQLSLLFEGKEALKVNDKFQVYPDKTFPNCLGMFYVTNVIDGKMTEIEIPLTQLIVCQNVPAEEIVEYA